MGFWGKIIIIGTALLKAVLFKVDSVCHVKNESV